MMMFLVIIIAVLISGYIDVIGQAARIETQLKLIPLHDLFHDLRMDSADTEHFYPRQIYNATVSRY